MRRISTALAVIAAAAAVGGVQAQEQRKTPYWASISAGEALMRTGPGKNYPGTWLYQRADLPIKVVEVYPSWRKVQDPDGETGWMLVNLLSEQRTALVTGEAPRDMHEAPSSEARVVYRAEPGVVGRISQCATGWCRLDVRGRAGFIRAEEIWGTDGNETLD